MGHTARSHGVKRFQVVDSADAGDGPCLSYVESLLFLESCRGGLKLKRKAMESAAETELSADEPANEDTERMFFRTKAIRNLGK